MVEAGAVKKPPAADGRQREAGASTGRTYGSVGGDVLRFSFEREHEVAGVDSPKFFAAHNYQVPTTWAQLMSLSAQIASSGTTKPWCGGISSGTARAARPATDWMEEVVLGKYGAKVYADWIFDKVNGFASPQIKDAMTIVHNWMQNLAWVNGGFGNVETIAGTTFEKRYGQPDPEGRVRDAAAGVVLRGAVAGWHERRPERRRSAFKLPAVNPQIRTPVEGGGEFLIAFSSDVATGGGEIHLSSPQWADSRIKVAPGWVSANAEGGPEAQHRPDRPAVGEVPRRPDRDLSPSTPPTRSLAAVGAGQEWKSMVPTGPIARTAPVRRHRRADRRGLARQPSEPAGTNAITGAVRGRCARGPP